jgi:putative glycosyltransferase (TIGR04372 family)
MAKLFQKSDLPPGVALTDVGLRPERPFQILGMIETLAFGDLLTNLVFFSTLANQFDHVRLHVRYRDVRPYSRDVMSLSPWIDFAEPVSERWPLWMPGPKGRPRRVTDFGSQKGKNVPLYDMVVTSHMAQREVTYALPNPVPLRLPEGRIAELRKRLEGRGLSPDHWFAAIHYRESTYEFRHEGSNRDNDPMAFDSLVDAIIAQGGQVVRLGHVGMKPFRPRKGFIDLIAETTLVQAAAASFARYMVIGPSGVFGLATGFQVPTTIVDAVDNIGLWGPVDALTHEVKTPNRETLRNASLREAGLLEGVLLAERIKADPRYSVRKANADELGIVAARLYARTQDCPAWRMPAPLPAGPKPNHVIWPLRPTLPQIQWVEV